VKSYQAAADESKFQSVKDLYLADAARVLQVAGKNDDAKKIWEELASRPDSPSTAEAKVRLGELSAAPAGKN
jgi:TolA-binding protein